MFSRLRPRSRHFQEAAQGIIRLLTPSESCPACLERERTSESILSTLMETIQDDQMNKALSKSSGLCLSHFRRAIRLAKDEKAVSVLLGIQRAKLEKLDVELAELIRKHDYRFREEGFGPEGDSWRRAIRLISGERRDQG